MLIKDSKPQVGIFEFVEGILLDDAEDTIPTWRDRYFDGQYPHIHANDIKRLVASHPGISEETKKKFASNPAEYLKWPRGRVDYDTVDKQWHIMGSAKLLKDENLVEMIARRFHLPPLMSGKIVLEIDEGHYGF